MNADLEKREFFERDAFGRVTTVSAWRGWCPANAPPHVAVVPAGAAALPGAAGEPVLATAGPVRLAAAPRANATACNLVHRTDHGSHQKLR